MTRDPQNAARFATYLEVMNDDQNRRDFRRDIDEGLRRMVLWLALGCAFIAVAVLAWAITVGLEKAAYDAANRAEIAAAHGFDFIPKGTTE